MTLKDRALVQLRRLREENEQILQKFETGLLTVGEKQKQGEGWSDVDTTKEWIKRYRRYIEEIDAILGEAS